MHVIGYAIRTCLNGLLKLSDSVFWYCDYSGVLTGIRPLQEQVLPPGLQ